jgi:pyridoxamine 5'-phosphate oxidase
MDIPDTLIQDFSGPALHRDSLCADPLEQFDTWFKTAIEAGYPAPNAVSLATSSATAKPTLRTVLIKRFDQAGFVFYTNYGSSKATEIEENSHVSLLFPWVSLGRQVIVSGHARKVSRTQSEGYFSSRSRASQLSAWSSFQSRPVDSRATLERVLAETQARFADREIAVPEFWGGYCVEACNYEFWQSRPNRLHDRFRYNRGPDKGWTIERLSP